MRLSPLIAGIISFIIPGLGQFISGKPERGAFIMAVVLLTGNLNAIWLSVYANTAHGFYSFILPRYLHDVMALYGSSSGFCRRWTVIGWSRGNNWLNHDI